MHALRHSSSQFASSFNFHSSCTLVDLVRKGSKGAYNRKFITGVATANVHVDSSVLKESSDPKYNKVENHSTGKQTGSSASNTSITSIKKKLESKKDPFTKEKITRRENLSGTFGGKSKAHQRNNNSSGSLKNFLIACAPNEDDDNSNNLKTRATQDVQIPVPNDSSEDNNDFAELDYPSTGLQSTELAFKPLNSSEDNDDFVELDYPSTDLQSTELAFKPLNNLLTNATQHVQMLLPNGCSEENDDFTELYSSSTGSQSVKLATAIEKGSSSRKKRRPSADSEATLPEESFCKMLGSVPTSSRSIPARKPSINFEKNGERVDSAQFSQLRFILGDHQKVGKEKKDELAGKQMSLNQVKESNTILGGERSVRIEYVPRGITLFHLREALSIHGEIVGFFSQNGDNAMPTCYIEFKTKEAKERALSARWLFVNGKQLSISRSDCPATTIVRISNLSPQTTATTVHSVCMSYGNVESLQTRKDGSMDVHYSIHELLNMPKILEMLNEVAINGSRWIAQPAPRLPQGLAKTPEGQKWVGKQLSNYIGNIKKHLQLIRIYSEDMEELHNAVRHIKECCKLVNDDSFSKT